MTALGIEAVLYILSDGAGAVEFFAKIEEEDLRCPALLLLDLNLPRLDGFAVLSYLRDANPRGAKRCPSMPVVVMTSSSARSDRERSASFHIAEYFNKPSTLEEFLALGEVIRKLI